MNGTEDFKFPSLKPDIKIYRSASMDGEPTWTLHDPSSGQYYKIDWISFEFLSRLSKFDSADDIIEDIKKTTTLRPSIDDAKNIADFLIKCKLTTGSISYKKPEEKSFLSKLIHGYLYFSIPILKPQRFLDNVYPKIEFLFSALFIKTMMIFLVLMVLWTIPRIDEFLKSYVSILSWEGAAISLFTLLFVKIIHEFSHAFTAKKYNVSVPHMGIVFMVLYPVLYTETTDSWKLDSPRARFHIGMAGIISELILAALFLLLWHITPSGTIVQSICFFIVVISLIGSLLINLNPLMRFDGYYMLSDAIGIDNLQLRSTQFARWHLRKILFGLSDPKPEHLKAEKENFLKSFGYALIVYRFFLFLGIALLVYHLFFKPLGLILMLIELVWFIALPAYSEIKVWWSRRSDILSSPRSITPLVVLLIFLGWIFIPWSGSISVPAIVHAKNHQDFYTPYNAVLRTIQVKDNQKIRSGEVLVTLESADLEYKLALAKSELNKITTLRSRASSNPVLMATSPITEEMVEQARLKVQTIETQKDKLIIRAPIDGIVRNMNDFLQPGQTISPKEKLFTVVSSDSAIITAYVTEGDQDKIEQGQIATFIPSTRFHGAFNAQVDKISHQPLADFTWRELFTPHRGPILADIDSENGAITPRRSVYELVATPKNDEISSLQMSERGYLKVRVQNSSIFHRFINDFSASLRSENMGLPL